MANDSITEVTDQSWLSRLGGAFKGILFGILLVVAAFILLFWNEGRAVKRHKTLQEGAGAVVSVSADRVDPAHEGDLVHISGRAQTDETLTDDTFGVAAPALRLERRVEMYQWQEEKHTETKKKTGGGTRTTTTYSYDKEWSERPIDSSRFHSSGGHENPQSMPWHSADWTADRVTVGAFRLSPGLVSDIDRWQALPVTGTDNLPPELRGRVRLESDGYYAGGGSPSSPEIGDVRISFRVVEPTEVSIVSRQVGESFRPYQAKAGGTVELLELGTVGAEQMFAAAERQNTLLTWGLRLVGLLLMAFGFSRMLRPLVVFADVLPPVGSLVGAGVGVVSFLLAAVISLLTIAVAWVVYRPLLGVTLIVLAVGALVYLVVRARRAKPVAAPAGARPATGPAVPPPPPPPPA